MNTLEQTTSSTDNHSPDERKKSPPAFLDLADSVRVRVYASALAYALPRLRGWEVICPICRR